MTYILIYSSGSVIETAEYETKEEVIQAYKELMTYYTNIKVAKLMEVDIDINVKE